MQTEGRDFNLAQLLVVGAVEPWILGRRETNFLAAGQGDNDDAVPANGGTWGVNQCAHAIF